MDVTLNRYSTNDGNAHYNKLLMASLRKLNRSIPVIRVETRLKTLCSADDNFCMFCNAMQLKERAAYSIKFGNHDAGAATSQAKLDAGEETPANILTRMYDRQAKIDRQRRRQIERKNRATRMK